MAKVFKDVPVTATIVFDLIAETHEVDIQKGLAKLGSEELLEILKDGGRISRDLSTYRVIHAVDKDNAVLRESFVRYCKAFKDLEEKFDPEEPGAGLGIVAEPEVKASAGEFTAWLTENAPRVLQQAEKDGFTPPVPKAAAAAPGL